METELQLRDSGAETEQDSPADAEEHPRRETEQVSPANPPSGPFLIVGLGASAGGIAALTAFFDHMPSTSGMAFVVIVHMSPVQPSNLAELLQQHTAMPVMQVTQAVKVAPNSVYVIPPAHHLGMSDGSIELTRSAEQRGGRIEIDHFFRALAEAHGTSTAGVVLSGTGADGAIGLPRIKEMGGVTVVQDPDEAEYSEMPRNAIATGLVDYVLPVAAMPQRLISYWENAQQIILPVEDEGQEAPAQVVQDDHVAQVLAFLNSRTGQDFAAYKRTTVLRRIQRRMQVNNVFTLAEYLSFLRQHPAEIQALLRDLLISVTNFFRDPAAWEALAAEGLAPLFQQRAEGDPVRVWVAGCATGEEAYSMAILLHEQAEQLAHPPRFQIFATDLDERAIGVAREGRYPETIVLDVSPERLRRFFIHEGGRYQVRKEIRDSVLFAMHNVLKDPPFSRLDIITCRNLLIYLNRDAQEQLLALFHFSLKAEGRLFLGMSESTDGMAHLYTTLDKKQRLYARRLLPRSTTPIPILPISKANRQDGIPSTIVPTERVPSVGELHTTMLEQYAPPSVVVNENYDIIHLSNRAGRYLQLGGGEPSYNIVRVIHPDLRLDLRSALYTALQKGKSNETRRILVKLDGTERMIRLIVQPMLEPEALRGHALVLFDEIEEAADAFRIGGLAVESVSQQLEEEIQLLREQLRLTIEQYETSVEELRASNEELQAMNEELRSTTEELETSREELQAVNEELLTVNQELKSRVDQLSQVNSDLQNLMASTDIGTMFLDRGLRIKLYTPQVQQIFNIIPSDMNRPLSHVTHKLQANNLLEDAEQVLQRLAPIEREIQTTAGQWYLIRLLPYRTVENKIDGVVLTFMDITDRTRAAQEREGLIRQLDEERARFEAVVRQMPAGLIIAEAPSGRVTYANDQSARLWGVPTPPFSESITGYGTSYSSLRPDGTPVPAGAWPMMRAIQQGETIFNEEIMLVLPDQRRITLIINAAPLRDRDDQITGGIVTWHDISARRAMEEELRQARDHMEQRIEERTAELAQTNAALQAEVAERRRADQARRELLRQLVRAQEEEQRHISRELHDQLGQSLTGLHFILDTLTRRATPAQSDHLNEASAIVNDLTQRVSELSLDLRPPVLDDLGLVPALLNLVERYTARTRVQVDLQYSGLEERLDPAVETVVFRVVQEALTNVARHAGTRQVTVQILNDNDVTVRIEDRGKGFDPDAVQTAANTSGLFGMNERVELIGGSLTIESAPGRGTRVIAQLPRDPTPTQES